MIFSSLAFFVAMVEWEQSSHTFRCKRSGVNPYLRQDSTFTVGIPMVKVESHLNWQSFKATDD